MRRITAVSRISATSVRRPGQRGHASTSNPKLRPARKDGVFLAFVEGQDYSPVLLDARLQQRWCNLIPIHAPRHASWLNQIETYFSIVQRKLLTPNEFASLAALEHYLLAFQARYQTRATPFRWTFTRADLHQLLARLADTADPLRPAA